MKWVNVEGMDTPSDSTPLHCVECGMQLFYAGVGRRPRYCSQTCRSRAWEKRRAARDGLVAQEVVEHRVEVTVAPTAEDVAAWLNDHPKRLSKVLKLMEWTQRQKDGLRAGLEGADCDLTVIGQQELDLVTGRAELVVAKDELRALRRKNEVLWKENQRLKSGGEQRKKPRRKSAPQPQRRKVTMPSVDDIEPPFGGGERVIIHGGKEFVVPSEWSDKEAHEFAREYPHLGE